MYYFTNSKGVRYQDKNLSVVRRKARWYLNRLQNINVIDIVSDKQGYMGNVLKTDNGVFIWSPAKGKRLAYKDQTYLGYRQSYVNEDGTLGGQLDSPIAPFNVYRYN